MSDSFHGILVEDCSEKETLSFLLETGEKLANQKHSKLRLMSLGMNHPS
jgi:hypothetical protein